MFTKFFAAMRIECYKRLQRSTDFRHEIEQFQKQQ